MCFLSPHSSKDACLLPRDCVTDQHPFLFRSIYRRGNSRAEALQPHRKANMFQSEDHGPQALLRATKQWSPGVREIYHSCRCAYQVLVFLDGTWGYRGVAEGLQGVGLQRGRGGVTGRWVRDYRGMGKRLGVREGLQRGGGEVTGLQRDEGEVGERLQMGG